MGKRLRLAIQGTVQGVGFRPFVYRLATHLGLSGWVMNTPEGVTLEAEGGSAVLDSFLVRLTKEAPRRAAILSMSSTLLSAVGYSGFKIKASEGGKEVSSVITPDIATCPECLAEILDSGNRRYLYPFTNCTNCGPRYSIVTALPYDRRNTTMSRFTMCPECLREYNDPENRRFHAQPNACPICGPQLAFWDAGGVTRATRNSALHHAATAVRNGTVLAVKGLGGFHLIVDARNEKAVSLLRQRKHREDKPLALMFPDLLSVRSICQLSDLEERLLLSTEAPIVLLRRSSVTKMKIAPSVAPQSPSLGIMLPYTPLHHLLMREWGFPVVATSGNLSDETICYDEQEAVLRLEGIADCFLVHDRPIARHADDSITRVVLGRELVLRRARGYAPLPVGESKSDQSVILALGGQLKNTVALSNGQHIVVSQHIGDLGSGRTLEAFKKAADDLLMLHAKRPTSVACDMHPDYHSTLFAHSLSFPVTRVQHHHAHIASCMEENGLDGEVLGVAWDGTGYGIDGTVWGGEFLVTSDAGFERVASLRPFRLPGGDGAVREPRRTAMAILHAVVGDAVFDDTSLAPVRSCSPRELRLLRSMLSSGRHAPITTSAGRLFDALASIIGIRQTVTYEGQAAMELENLIGENRSGDCYPMEFVDCDPTMHALLPKVNPLFVVDWAPMILEVLRDLRSGRSQPLIAQHIHNGMAAAIVRAASRIGNERVVLSGGCFQNAVLLERTIQMLKIAGINPYWHRKLPSNDGGICVGQLRVARLSRDTETTLFRQDDHGKSTLGVTTTSQEGCHNAT